METEKFKGTILDKRIKNGWFSTSYYATIRFENGGESKILERRLNVNQYYDVKIGDVLSITMYSRNGTTWYFSEEEARLY